MKTVRELLQNPDPLQHDPHPPLHERARLRHAVISAANRATMPDTPLLQSRMPIPVAATLAVIATAIIRFPSMVARDSRFTGGREI
jgi:hypothetical protein